MMFWARSFIELWFDKISHDLRFPSRWDRQPSDKSLQYGWLVLKPTVALSPRILIQNFSVWLKV